MTGLCLQVNCSRPGAVQDWMTKYVEWSTQTVFRYFIFISSIKFLCSLDVLSLNVCRTAEVFSYRLFPLPLQACFAVLSCRVLSTETVITSRVGFKISLAETTKFTRSGYVAVWPVRILHRNILNANPVRCLLRINYRRNTQELITMAKS